MRILGAMMCLLLGAGCRFDLPPTPAADAPLSPVTAFRKPITIDAARVTGGQAEFPVWIVLDGDADLQAHATESGSDLHFTAGDGAPIPYQIQRWTKSIGRLEAWVRADLDDVADTVLELRYGDPPRAHPPDPPLVFSNAFLTVWHLDDPLTAPAVLDTVGAHPGTASGLGASDQVPAQLGGGVDFDGSSQRITFVSPLAGGVEHTISAWVNQRTATDYDNIITMGNPATNQARFFHSHASNGMYVGFWANDWTGSLPDIENAGWALVHWTYRNRQSRMYRDGVEVETHTFSSGVNTQGTGGYLGYAPGAWGSGGTTPCALNGILDEVRISAVERSAGWIATEHANQSSPQTFYRIGPEQPSP